MSISEGLEKFVDCPGINENEVEGDGKRDRKKDCRIRDQL